MRTRSALTVLLFVTMAILPTMMLFLIFEQWYHFWMASVMSASIFGVMISGIGATLLTDTLEVDRISTELTDKAAMRRILYHLRGIGNDVEEHEGTLVVRLDQYRTAKVLVRPSVQGSDIIVVPGLTSNGIGLIFFLCVFVPFGGIAAMFTNYGSNRKVSIFSAGVLWPTISYLETNEEDESAAGRANIDLVVLDTLQQAERLASEAQLSLKASFDDSVWLMVALGMLAFVVMFLTLGFGHNDQGVWAMNTEVVLATLALTVGAIIGVALYLRKVYLTRSHGLGDRIAEIRAALVRERGLFPFKEGDDTGLSMILRIWPEMPVWARYCRRNFFRRNPLTSVLTATMFLVAWQAAMFGGIGMYLAFGSLAGAVALYIITKLNNIKDDREMLRDWNEKVEELSAKIDSKLREL